MYPLMWVLSVTKFYWCLESRWPTGQFVKQFNSYKAVGNLGKCKWTSFLQSVNLTVLWLLHALNFRGWESNFVSNHFMLKKPGKVTHLIPHSVSKFIFLYLFFSFQEIIKAFNITRPMIPPRLDVNHRNTAGPSNHRNQNEDDDGDEWRLPVQKRMTKNLTKMISAEKGIYEE